MENGDRESTKSVENSSSEKTPVVSTTWLEMITEVEIKRMGKGKHDQVLLLTLANGQRYAIGLNGAVGAAIRKTVGASASPVILAGADELPRSNGGRTG
jgi:hypothetical protein